MSLTKLTFPGLDIYIDLNEIIYMEQEIPPPSSGLIILPTEKNYYTRLSLKNGKTIMVAESAAEIIALRDGGTNSSQLLNETSVTQQ